MTTPRSITIRVNIDDLENIEDIAEAIPLASHHRIARTAMRFGLIHMVPDPELALALLVTPPPTRKAV